MLLSWLRGQINLNTNKRSRRRPITLALHAEGLEERSVPSATLVRDINIDTGNSLGYAYTEMGRGAELNGKLYYFADDGIHGRELWARPTAP